MFTGIVEITGRITSTSHVPGGRRLTVDVGPMANEVKQGDSIAVNGICLTATQIAPPRVSFDVIQETLARTTLDGLRIDSRVNLERSLKPESRLDGHFVQGHVDGKAGVTKIIADASQWVVWLRPSEVIAAYIIPKGSVALDGVSLTIASVDHGAFSVALIPTTLERTNLGELKTGSEVNVETDVIVRTVIHRLDAMTGDALTFEKLKDAGFA